MATGYGLDDRGIRVRVPEGSRMLTSTYRPGHLWRPLSQWIQWSNPMGNGGSFPGDKEAGAWSWPFNSNKFHGQEISDLYIHPHSSASELYRPSDSRLSAKLVPTFANRGRFVISTTDPHDRNLGFLDRSRYYFFQVAPQLYSRGWLDPVPDPLLLGKSGIAGNQNQTSGSVAKNSDH
jgi:hypothetical protein